MPELVSPALAAGRLSGQPQPWLSVDELILRPFQPKDAADVVAAYADPDIQYWHARSVSEEEALDWVNSWSAQWAAETAASWAVVEGDTLLGRMGLRTLNLGEARAEVAYWVLPAARGRAVAPRALCAMTDWLFAVIGLERIELLHSTRNEPSCRVAHKAGYQYEGTLRGQCLHADGWHDMHLHARLRNDPGPPTAGA